MVKEKETVSIIIPSFEKPDDVLELLRSLGSQVDVRRDEIIVVDDGSRQVKQLRLKNGIDELTLPNITLLQEGHHGVAQTRNTGIQSASKKLLVFIDQDCIARPHYIDEMTTVAKTAEAIQGNYWTQRINSNLDRQHMEYRRLVSEALRTSSSGNFGVNTRNFAIKRDVLLYICGDKPFKTGSFYLHGAEDKQFGQELRDKGMKIVLAKNAIVEHTGDPGDLRGLMIQKFHHAMADAVRNVLPPDTFSIGNFNRAVINPINNGIDFHLALCLWASFVAGAATGKILSIKHRKNST